MQRETQGETVERLSREMIEELMNLIHGHTTLADGVVEDQFRGHCTAMVAGLVEDLAGALATDGFTRWYAEVDQVVLKGGEAKLVAKGLIDDNSVGLGRSFKHVFVVGADHSHVIQALYQGGDADNPGLFDHGEAA